MLHDHLASAAEARLLSQTCFAPSAAEASRPSGRSTKFHMNTSVGPVEAYLSAPDAGSSNAPPLLALHGISRDAQSVFDAFSEAPNNAGRVVIAPCFEARKWPVYQRITHRNRADIALLELLTSLRAFGVIDGGPADLFGFSGGAQLAHRFAMLYPHMVSSLHVSSAGWYSLPNEDAPYPYGLGAPDEKEQVWRRRMLLGLDVFLRLPISIYVGCDDIGTDEPTLRRNPALDAAQGSSRRARAASYCDALCAAAVVHGGQAAVRHFELPGCGHSFDECVETGGLIDLVLS